MIKMIMHISRKNYGFTLIEVLIALVMIAIALVAITLSINDSTSAQLTLEQNQAAYQLADNIAAQLVGLKKPQISMAGNDTINGIDLNYQISHTTQDDLSGYDVEVSHANHQLIDLKVYGYE